MHSKAQFFTTYRVRVFSNDKSKLGEWKSSSSWLCSINMTWIAVSTAKLMLLLLSLLWIAISPSNWYWYEKRKSLIVNFFSSAITVFITQVFLIRLTYFLIEFDFIALKLVFTLFEIKKSCLTTLHFLKVII